MSNRGMDSRMAEAERHAMAQAKQLSPPVFAGGAAAGLGTIGTMWRPPTPRERLTQQKAQIEDALERINHALSVLDANPGIEDAISALAAAGVNL